MKVWWMGWEDGLEGRVGRMGWRESWYGGFLEAVDFANITGRRKSWDEGLR